MVGPRRYRLTDRHASNNRPCVSISIACYDVHRQEPGWLDSKEADMIYVVCLCNCFSTVVGGVASLHELISSHCLSQRHHSRSFSVLHCSRYQSRSENSQKKIPHNTYRCALYFTLYLHYIIYYIHINMMYIQQSRRIDMHAAWHRFQPAD